MKLKKLRLVNFKGIKDLTVEFGGVDTNIYGENATGKTTIADAFFWLLFDKDSQNKKQFEIKTLVDGEPVSKLDHSVEGSFELASGKNVKLKKVYTEIWTRKRGDADKTFTGHETNYFVEDVPKTKGEYNTRVAEITATEDRFQLLTSPSFFPERLSWQKQRELLLEVCGDISDSDVIAGNPDLAGLAEIMDGKSVDDFRDMIVAQRRDVNRKIESIPSRVDEATRAIPQLEIAVADPVVAKLKKLRTAQEKKVAEIASLKVGGGAEEKRLAIATLDAAIAEARNKHNASIDTSAADLRGKDKKELLAVEGLIATTTKPKNDTLNSIASTELKISVIARRIESLVADWKTENARTYNGSNVCPTCSQQMPEEMMEAALASFNEGKANEKARIEQAGATCKTEKDALSVSLIKLQGKVAELEEEEKRLSAFAGEIEKRLAAEIPSNIPRWEETPEYQQLTEEKAALEAEAKAIREGGVLVVVKAVTEKEAIDADIATQEKLLAAIEQSYKCRDRIRELGEEERVLAAEFEKLESWLYLLDMFIKTKVSVMEGKINQKFSLVTFKLFKEQVNGGIQETCEVMVNGVPYGSLNSAGRVQAGLDIITTLSEYYGFAPPIFIDNRESIVSLPEMQAQVISLIVSAQDKSLRVERVGKLVEAEAA